MSVAGAAAISEGLGAPGGSVSSDELLDAASDLVALAVSSTPEDVGKSARTLRALLDVEGAADLEAHRRSKRFLKWCELPDGTTRVTAVLDPESAAVVVGAISTALSPRRGGPRFVDAADRERASSLLSDSRTNDQLAVDVLVEIIELATRAAGSSIDDSNQFGAAGVFGQKSPAVRLHVQAESLEAGVGLAYFEGQSGIVSIQTAERHICKSGILPILFDEDRPIDVGRATLANGICLCRFHHMEVHANGWGIHARDDGTYWLIPPSTLDSSQAPIELHSKSPLRRAG